MSDVTKSSWLYYQRLEEEVKSTLFYIDWDVRHFKVFSPQLTILLSRIGNEADILFKQLYAKYTKKSVSRSNITDYRKILEPKLKLSKVTIFLLGIRKNGPIPKSVSYKPFDGFAASKSPNWWVAYNKTKHERHINPQEGNFENVIKGLGAILWLNLLNFNDSPKKPLEADLSEVNFEYPHSLFELEISIMQRVTSGYVTKVRFGKTIKRPIRAKS